jgi:hypothetical protein
MTRRSLAVYLLLSASSSTLLATGCEDATTLLPVCANNQLDPGETAVDCGGPCGGCVGDPCDQAGLCASLSCVAGACTLPTCVDGVRNGSELGIDCGATCAPCTTSTSDVVGADGSDTGSPDAVGPTGAAALAFAQVQGADNEPCAGTARCTVFVPSADGAVTSLEIAYTRGEQPVAGQVVSFAITDDPDELGFLTSASGTTDARGIATLGVSVTKVQAGTFALRAFVEGLAPLHFDVVSRSQLAGLTFKDLGPDNTLDFGQVAADEGRAGSIVMLNSTNYPIVLRELHFAENTPFEIFHFDLRRENNVVIFSPPKTVWPGEEDGIGFSYFQGDNPQPVSTEFLLVTDEVGYPGYVFTVMANQP